jgi:hypothetical protein
LKIEADKGNLEEVKAIASDVSPTKKRSISMARELTPL